MKIFRLLWVGLLAALLLLGLRWQQTAHSSGPARLPQLVTRDFPVRLRTGPDQELEFRSAPRRILPANAAWVDFVSLLVGPERLAALPAEAFGYSRLAQVDAQWSALPTLPAFEAERALAFRPDLVLAHAWQSPETLATLRRAGVPVLVVPVPESWTEIVDTLELLGVVLGVPERAAELGRLHEHRREDLGRRARRFAGLRALCYSNLGAGGWTAGARTTADVLLGLAGLRNAAAEAGLAGDVPADLERLIDLDPDVFVVGRPESTERSQPSAEFLLGEPALTGIEAIRAGRIVALPPQLFTTASPELLRGAELLIAALEAR